MWLILPLYSRSPFVTIVTIQRSTQTNIFQTAVLSQTNSKTTSLLGTELKYEYPGKCWCAEMMLSPITATHTHTGFCLLMNFFLHCQRWLSPSTYYMYSSDFQSATDSAFTPSSACLVLGLWERNSFVTHFKTKSSKRCTDDIVVIQVTEENCPTFCNSMHVHTADCSMNIVLLPHIIDRRTAH